MNNQVSYVTCNYHNQDATVHVNTLLKNYDPCARNKKKTFTTTDQHIICMFLNQNTLCSV